MKRDNLDSLRLIVPPSSLVLALPAMAFSTWLTLTVAGIAMGMMLFLMASGLTLIFGLMDVLNFAHGAFITLGAYRRPSACSARSPPWSRRAQLGAQSRRPRRAAAGRGAVVGGLAGLVFERVIIRRVQGSHLRQILITVGGLIVAQRTDRGALGRRAAAPSPSPRCCAAASSSAARRSRATASSPIALGLAVYSAMHLVLNRTRIGLLVRAGVENREMVEALGFRIRRLFVGVFVAGTALAGIGGVMWAIYQELVTAAIGAEMTDPRVHHRHHRRPGLGRRLPRRRDPGRPDRQLHRLPRAQAGARLQHRGSWSLILLWRPRGLFPLSKS